MTAFQLQLKLKCYSPKVVYLQHHLLLLQCGQQASVWPVITYSFRSMSNFLAKKVVHFFTWKICYCARCSVQPDISTIIMVINMANTHTDRQRLFLTQCSVIHGHHHHNCEQMYAMIDIASKGEKKIVHTLLPRRRR